MDVKELIGKYVRFDGTRWGILHRTYRMQSPKDIVKITKSTERKIKRPTMLGVVLKGPVLSNGKFIFSLDNEIFLPATAIECYRERKNGKDIPVVLE